MATQLTITGTAAGNATLVGAWELRAGSADSAEWLDGAADVAYPGGGPGTFNASNSDGANGYDPAPKMALITLGSTTDGQTIILGGGATSILSHIVSAGTANMAQTIGGNHSGLTITLETSGTVTSGQLIVFYN
tara:strand:- start:31380 stop:31781 length:402 start_codon:yes stop_codon:yes gene_type:complete